MAKVEIKIMFEPAFPGETFEERIGGKIQDAVKRERDRYLPLFEALKDIGVLKDEDRTPTEATIIDNIEREVLKVKP